jgi:signal transduction histidine kinase
MWISLRSVDGVRMGPDISRRLWSNEATRRLPEHTLFIFFLAHWFPDIRHRLCPIKGYRSQQTILESYGKSSVIAASFFIAGNAVLPRIQVDPLRLSSVWLYLGVLVSIFAFIVLWTRWRSVLDLWLMVVICAYAVEISLSYFPVPLRYSFGWYAGRAFGLFSSSLVLWVLLYEITTLYAVTAIVRVQRAKASLRTVQAELARVSRVTTLGQLAASIAHEITQPIASSRNNARAALNFLDRQPPDLSKVKQALQYVVADADRAGDIIGRIRDHIKKAPPRKDRFDLNEAINEVIVLARSTITENGVSVQIRLAEGRLPVHGDRTQLRQVVLNLILNALEAMSSVEAGQESC